MEDAAHFETRDRIPRRPARVMNDEPTDLSAALHPAQHTADLIRWILTEGRAQPTISRFVNTVCWRLIDAGAPLWRASIFASTLHPQLSGFGWRWWRHNRVTEEIRIQRGVERTPDFLLSPLRGTIERGETFHRPLDGTSPDMPLLDEIYREGGTDYLAMPLNRIGRRFPAVSFVTDHPDGFEPQHVRLLEEIRPALAAVIESAAIRRTARTLFSIYHGRQVGERIFDGQILRGSLEPLRAVVMATDLRGFTSISDRLPGEVVIQALDDYFEHVARAIHDAGGHILKFVGDGVLAIFDAAPGKDADAAVSALDAARELVTRLETYNGHHADTNDPVLRTGVGLHLGTVMYGNVGSHDRLDFTAIGPAVNLAFRLEGMTKELLRPVVASKAFAEAAGDAMRSLGRYPIRGLAETEELFGLREHDRETP
jgi:adenylate cyclase